MARWIIPAYAGSTCLSAMQEVCGKDHPRIRGEHPLVHRLREKLPGSSPHTRGAHGLHRQSPGSRRIIPAYAGSTAPPRPQGRCPRDHPRIRGEHAVFAVDVDGRSRIIPAYAGSTMSGQATL